MATDPGYVSERMALMRRRLARNGIGITEETAKLLMLQKQDPVAKPVTDEQTIAEDTEEDADYEEND